MTDPIVIVVNGRPVPWARSGGNGKIRFTPANVRAWQNDARILARQAMAGRDPIAGPCRLTVVAVFDVPGSWPGWKQGLALDNRLAHVARPDADNLTKNAKDALNNIVYRDDSQVIAEIGLKLYGRQPCMKIIVEPLDFLPSTITRRPDDGKPAPRLVHSGDPLAPPDIPTRNQERRELRAAMERFFADGGKVLACPAAYGAEVQAAAPLGRLPHAREKSEGHWKTRKFNFRGGGR